VSAGPVVSVGRVSVPAGDAETQEWLEALAGKGARHEEAVARLHGLLLRAARFEVNRRKRVLPHLRGEELDDIAVQSADDALVSVLARLTDFRGESRFTTWAYKFAILEAAVALRRRAWQGREIPIEPERWPLVPSGGPSPEADTEQRELLEAISEGVREALTPHQRRVLVSVVLDDVPIDVLAERLSTTRGALYKTLHDARARLRADLEERGLARDHEGSKP
jgi:RNA polymerase sigma-70 factor (ECF subfamily)